MAENKIRHASFKHGWFYHYRVHTEKVARLPQYFSLLSDFLHSVFDSRPDEYFLSGPRCSHAQLDYAFSIDHQKEHAICKLAATSHEISHYKTAHSRVQVTMLELDHISLACEVPVWMLPEEFPGYENIFNSNEPLTGHIDVLSVENGNIWVWDYKPKARQEKYAHIQTYLYAVMLAKRTGLPLDIFRCGYFDEEDCYTFEPSKIAVPVLMN